MQVQATPGDCILTGLCGMVLPYRPIPSGILFVAVGLVLVGIAGLRARKVS
jgi:hypothetical protein